MSNLKVQSITHVLGTVDYLTTTDNENHDLQIGVGTNASSFVKAIEVNNLAEVSFPKNITAPKLNGIADTAIYTAESKTAILDDPLTIDEYYLNATEFIQMLSQLKAELEAEQDPDPPPV